MTGFLWNEVITAIAAIVDIELIDRGIDIYAVQPLLAQDCKMPILFPSRNPSINVTSVKRFSFGAATIAGRRHKGSTIYTLDWIYLHIQRPQQIDFNSREYEVAIRSNLAAIFRSLTRQDRSLGIGRVLPQSADIDYDIQDPTSGKQFLGGHIVVACDEIFEL